jgi:hypothetical protein
LHRATNGVGHCALAATTNMSPTKELLMWVPVVQCSGKSEIKNYCKELAFSPHEFKNLKMSLKVDS